MLMRRKAIIFHSVIQMVGIPGHSTRCRRDRSFLDSAPRARAERCRVPVCESSHGRLGESPLGCRLGLSAQPSWRRELRAVIRVVSDESSQAGIAAAPNLTSLRTAVCYWRPSQPAAPILGAGYR